MCSISVDIVKLCNYMDRHAWKIIYMLITPITCVYNLPCTIIEIIARYMDHLERSKNALYLIVYTI